jgi:oligo-1,6-glucosidase
MHCSKFIFVTTLVLSVWNHLTGQQSTAWWQSTFVYQIYPRSFKDSNGDGVGDLKGITAQLDYLQDLGVETVWLSPFYQSPMDDMGYDIADYYAVDTTFGTMADFDHMLSEMKKRNMRLVIDLVVNHSSDEHNWFKEARTSRTNPYHDFYIWKPGKKGTPPNNWPSIFGGSAWEWNEATKEYYLHLFTRKQPDLNWENPNMRQEIYKMMRFWLDKGVDGFRMDVIPFISKQQDFPDLNFSKPTLAEMADGIIATGPRLHEYLQEMNREVLSKYNIYTVGEAAGVSLNRAMDYIHPSRRELQTIYHFEHMEADRKDFAPVPFDFLKFKKTLSAWNNSTAGIAPNTIYLGNHDQVRSVSRYGNDQQYRVESAKMLATLVFTQSNIPYFLAGDEIGMTNAPFKDISEFRDVSAINAYQLMLQNNLPPAEAFKAVYPMTRDHSRTPFQWRNEKMGGFSNGDNTWLMVYHFYKKMIAYRKANPALVFGQYEELLPEHPQLFAYTRTHEGKKFLVVLNMSNQSATFDYNLKGYKKELGNYRSSKNAIMRPYEAKIYRWKQ